MFALRPADTGVAVAEVCRKLGISEATTYSWKKKYRGLGVPELRRLKQLAEENQQLKQLVANMSLGKQMRQDVLKKSAEARAASARNSPPARRLSYLRPTSLSSSELAAFQPRAGARG